MKLHGHTILTKLKIPSKLWDEQAAFVRGYILALEDTLGDINKILAETPERERNRRLVIRVQANVLATWEQARATLAAMEEMEDATANSPGASDTPGAASTTPGAPDPKDQGRVPD